MNLESRVSKLEEKIAQPGADRKALFVLFVEPFTPRPPLQRISHGERVWDRLEHEGDEAFKARAVADVGPQPGEGVTLFFAN